MFTDFDPQLPVCSALRNVTCSHSIPSLTPLPTCLAGDEVIISWESNRSATGKTKASPQPFDQLINRVRRIKLRVGVDVLAKRTERFPLGGDHPTSRIRVRTAVALAHLDLEPSTRRR